MRFGIEPSALVGKFVTGLTDGVGGDGISGHAMKGAMASVSGGLASVAGGGKFEDGATTAAFGYLFNEMLTRKDGTRFKSTGRLYRPDPTMSGQMELTREEAAAATPYVKVGLVFVPKVGIPILGMMDALEGYANFRQEKYNELTSSVASNIIAGGLQAASGGFQRTSTLIGQGYEKLFNQSTWPGVVNGDKSDSPK